MPESKRGGWRRTAANNEKNLLLTDVVATAAAAAALPCRTKLAVCGLFEILTPVRFLLVDNRLVAAAAPLPARLTYSVLASGALFNGTAAAAVGNRSGGASHHLVQFHLSNLGVHILAVYLDGQQVPHPPMPAQVLVNTNS
jgi:hypothetical protein